jgi:hypothetical protein
MSKGKWPVVMVAVCLVVTVAAVAYAAGKSRAAPVQEVVRARRFEVVGSSGKPYAVLAALETSVGARLSLLDKDGGVRGNLDFGNACNSPAPGGPVYLGISRRSPASGQITLGITENGDPQVVMMDRQGHWVCELQVGEDGVAELRLPGKNQMTRTVVGGGLLRIQRLDAQGPTVIWQAP